MGDLISQSGMQTMKEQGVPGADSDGSGGGGDIAKLMMMMLAGQGASGGNWNNKRTIGGGGGDWKKQKVSSGAPVKSALVEKIKTFQRSGEAEKQAWWSYCDMQPEQKRDPAFYDASFLQEFLNLHGI